MHKFVYAILSFTLFTSAQTVIVHSKPSEPVPRMEIGFVNGHTYRNSSIGIELTVADDALDYYPESQRGTDAYMRKVIRGNQQSGYEVFKENSNVSFGGVSFARSDFRGALYEAVLVKSCDVQAFVFIFASSGKDTVDKLIGQTDLKLEPARSGCHSANTVNK